MPLFVDKCDILPSIGTFYRHSLADILRHKLKGRIYETIFLREASLTWCMKGKERKGEK
jgi:hypothetical protein